MYILGIETTGPKGSCCIMDSQGKAAMRTTTQEMSHLRTLAENIDDLMKECGLRPGDIDLIGVSAGPGSFTGIRIGLATAKALAQVWEIPCISVNSLETYSKYCQQGRIVAAIFNARRGQVYGAVYGEEGEEILPPGPYMLDEVLAVCDVYQDKPVFYGDGVMAYRDRLAGRNMAPEEDLLQDAAMVCRIAQAKYQRGEAVSYAELQPLYMRKSEAEQKLQDGSLMRERENKLKRQKY